MDGFDEAAREDLLARRSSRNPFDVTKATDLTDDQIIETWVEIHNGALRDLLHIDSTMPRFLIGGKGGGRTHLMRYSSFAVQLRRSATYAGGHTSYFRDREGYLGIYFRCGGLNAGRFSGKGIHPEAWHAIFAYYTDLWLGRLYILVLQEFLDSAPVDQSNVKEFALRASDILSLEPQAGEHRPDNLAQLAGWLSTELQVIDRAVNNAAITRSIEVLVRANPGDLIFRLAQIGAELFAPISGLRIVYLLDEFENLTSAQQTYVNTLIREKQLPVNFVIGSRRYGVRTHSTLSAGEVNRRGSEYDEIVLEDYYRREKGEYEEFCRTLILQRLTDHGFERPKHVRDLFAAPPRIDAFGSAEALDALRGGVGIERRHFRKLMEQAKQFGGFSDSEAEQLVEYLRLDAHPVLEKYSAFKLYRHWANRGAIDLDVARQIAGQTLELKSGRGPKNVRTTFLHYRADLLAQILRENGQPLSQYGVGSFVLMSGYLPRNLLVTLKQITRWAIFQGEDPFRGQPVSLEAQRRGVSDSSTWFLKNARATGIVGEENEAIITRVGSFLKALRFQDKPADVSVCMIAVQRTRTSSQARARLDHLVDHSLLIELPDGLHAKNGEDVLSKYQLHPMLAPSFDLPIGRRGTTILSDHEVDVLFDPTSSEQELRSLIRLRSARMSAPFRPLTEPESSNRLDIIDSDDGETLF